MLAAQAALGWFAAAPEHLAGHDKCIAAPAQFFQGIAHQDFGFSGFIAFRVVEKINPRIIGGGHQLQGVALMHLLLKVTHEPSENSLT